MTLIKEDCLLNDVKTAKARNLSRKERTMFPQFILILNTKTRLIR